MEILWISTQSSYLLSKLMNIIISKAAQNENIYIHDGDIVDLNLAYDSYLLVQLMSMILTTL